MLKNAIEKLTKRFPDIHRFGFIAITIFIFNIIAIWGAKNPVWDDAHTYWYVVANKFPHFLVNGGSIIAAICEWFSWHLMVMFSIQLVRFIYVLFLLIPLSWLFYKLLRRYFDIPEIPALFASIIPAILPSQWQVPALTNDSYPIPILLLSLAALLCGYRYMDTDQKPKRWISCAFFLYLLATQYYDNAVFMFPVLFLAALFYKKFNRKTLFILMAYTLPFLLKLTWIIVFPRQPAAERVWQNFQEIIKRIYYYFISMTPLPYSFLRQSPKLFLIIVAIIIVTGFTIYFFKKGFSSTSIENTHDETKPYGFLNPRFRILFVYTFFFVWIVSTIILFITASVWRQERYFFITAYAFNALLILSLYAILEKILGKKKKIIAAVFIILVIVSGTFRFMELKKIYDDYNRQDSIMKNELVKHKNVANPQILVYIPDKWINYWDLDEQSTGFLQYWMNKKKDVWGTFIHHREYTYIKKAPRYWNKPKIYWERPLFLYAYKDGKFTQYEYALIWKQSSDNQYWWRIYKFDKNTGLRSTLVEGNGLPQYRETVKDLRNKGIITGKILWGEPL